MKPFPPGEKFFFLTRMMNKPGKSYRLPAFGRIKL